MFVILFALGNFLGPILLGRLFDTVGRKPMIVLTYLGSSAIALAMALLFLGGSLTRWSLEGFIIATFFLASAGASAAYLTVSEVFPMETRALAIAFFYAVGTAVGGITGPLRLQPSDRLREPCPGGHRVPHRACAHGRRRPGRAAP